MITRRQSTQLPPEPKVKFYKIIALSFLLLTVALFGVVIFMTSKKAEIVVTAKEDKKNVKIVLHVGANRTPDTIKGVVTTTLVAFSEKYQPQGKKTIDSVATGEVIIYNKTNTAQPLVATTRLLSLEGVLFHLKDRVTVPPNGQVTAKVYADKPGKEYEIGPSFFTIPGLNLDKQKVIYAESKLPTIGGIKTVGVLSADDIKAATLATKEKIKEKVLGSNSNVIVDVISLSALQSREIGDEVTEFTQSGTGTVVIVSYDQNDLKSSISDQLYKSIDNSLEKVLSAQSKPVISIANYKAQDLTADLSIDQDILVTVDASADKLLPKNFVGKSKDEIERYLLGLSHVSGVTVKFSPAWMMTAPMSPENIKVMVKNVQ